MKKLAFAVLAATVISSTDVFAQPPAPVASLNAPAPGSRPRPEGPGPGENGLRPISTIQGKVVKFQANGDFVLDGIYLLNGTDSLLVKFPAHLGSQIAPLAKTGAQVSVSGVTENSPFGVKEVRLVSLTAGGKTIAETAPTAPEVVEETTLTGTGKVNSLQTDREGRVSGLFLDNKILLRLPPHVTGQLGTGVSKGATISYSGIQKAKTQGEVSLEDYKIIRCRTITVNGQQYLVK